MDPYSTDESSEHDMDVELVEPDSGCESQRVRDCIAACDRSQYCVNTYLSVHMVPLQDTLKSNATVLMARSEETCTICYGGLFDGRKAVVQLPCKCVDTTKFFCPRAFLPFLLIFAHVPSFHFSPNSLWIFAGTRFTRKAFESGCKVST